MNTYALKGRAARMAPLASVIDDAHLDEFNRNSAMPGAINPGTVELDELEAVEQEVAVPSPETLPEQTALGNIVELLLKDHAKLEGILRLEEGQRRAIPKLLFIGATAFALYGVVATFMLNLARVEAGFWLDYLPAARSDDGTIANLTLAYVVGMIAANGLCLPSFYFYGLLSGLRISMLGVTAHALKGMTAGAVALVGLLPVYVAATLGASFYVDSRQWLGVIILLGLALPFLAGFWAVRSLFRGFVALADTIPAECRVGRTCLLRRLIFAWAGCYTFVTPLVIYTLWQHLSLAGTR